MKKMKLLFMIAVITTCGFAQQSPKMTKKFFPDPEIEINTPSFSKSGFAKYEDIIEYIEQKIAGKEYVSLQYIGESQKGKKIPVVIFKGNDSKVKVLFTARIHGDEPGGTEAMLFLIDRLINDPSITELRQNTEIAILPIVNIDGGDKLTRTSNNGLDLNRDMSKLATPENIALRNFANNFVPEVYVDFHEYNPLRADYLKMGNYGVSGFADIMFLYCENLNYPKPLKELFDTIYLPSHEKKMTENRLTYYKYFTSAKAKGEMVVNIGGGSPRSSVTAYGLSNTIALLVEVRGTDLGKTSFKRRVYTSYLIAVNTLKTSLDNLSQVKKAVSEAMLYDADIVVTDKRKTEEYAVPFIDLESNEMVELTLPIRDAAKRTPSLVRKRPKAYAILPEYKHLADKLMQLGIKVETLSAEQTISAETYTVTEYKKEEEKFEGFHEQNVKTHTQQKSITLPVGTFMVDMKQRNANLAAVVLEPEAENGFVKYNVLLTKEGEELPIYRIPN